MIRTTATAGSRTVSDTAPSIEDALNIILSELRGDKMQITINLQADGTGEAIGTIVP
jgi:hypothetical protein